MIETYCFQQMLQVIIIKPFNLSHVKNTRFYQKIDLYKMKRSLDHHIFDLLVSSIDVAFNDDALDED